MHKSVFLSSSDLLTGSQLVAEVRARNQQLLQPIDPWAQAAAFPSANRLSAHLIALLCTNHLDKRCARRHRGYRRARACRNAIRLSPGWGLRVGRWSGMRSGVPLLVALCFTG